MSTDRPEPRPEAADIVAHIDGIDAHGVWGWAFDKNIPTRRLTIEALIDGQVAGRTPAEIYRHDLQQLGFGDGHAGFRVEFPPTFFNGDEREVKVRIVETGTLLTEIPIKLRFPTIQPETASLGYFDGIDPMLFVRGWAHIPERSEPARVEVFLDDNLVSEGTANLFRPDLFAAGLSFGRAGFKIPIPSGAIARLKSSVEVRVNGEPLTGSPKYLSLTDRVSAEIVGVKQGAVGIRLRGWPGGPIKGQMLFDGLHAGEVVLTRTAGREAPASCVEGSWAMPKTFRNGQPHVCAFEINHDGEVVRTDAVTVRYPPYLVCIDKANLREVSGWALREDRPYPLQVEAFHEGLRVGTTQTNVARQDVQTAYGLMHSATGFHLTLANPPRGSWANYLIKDSETGVTVADVAVANRYEALADLLYQWRRDEDLGSDARLRAILAPLVLASRDDTAVHFRSVPRAAPTLAHEVDVVVPVYGGYIETAECIQSVLSAQNAMRWRVIVINDCSPDPLIDDLLRSLEEKGRNDLIVIHRTKNGGFSEAVNLGMIAAGDRDVILLNADTVVQDGWIDRLAAAAESDSRIATVTPFTNNGEICTLPYMCKSLPVDTPELALAVDREAVRLNAGVTVDLPVAVGFCMFIRRACIDEIGLFDSAAWGRGYGEEVDFCLKAVAQGWRHVLAADTFVVHRGGVSFGNEKLERILESAKKITGRFPFYDQLIHRFIAADPVAAVRRNVNLGLIAGALNGSRVLHVTHAFGGGTEQYVRDLTKLYEQEGFEPLILRFGANGEADLEIELTKTTLAGFFLDRHIERYRNDELGGLRKAIETLAPDRVHIHSVFGIPSDLLGWLTSAFSFDATIHDYAWICPRVTLTLPGARYCGEPAVERCCECIAVYSPHPGLQHLLEDSNGDVGTYRTVLRSVLERASVVFAGSSDVSQRLERHGIAAKFRIADHPAPDDSPVRMPVALDPPGTGEGVIKVALLGGLSDIKGFFQLVECAKAALERQLPLRFIVFGDTLDDSRLTQYPNVQVLGRYEDKDLADLVQGHRPHLSFFPNQWPETFSYTLSHSFRMGLWPVATDIGAPADRIRRYQFGTLYGIDEPAERVCSLLLNAATRNRVPVERIIRSDSAASLAEYRSG